jgi:hypothetical protein
MVLYYDATIAVRNSSRRATDTIIYRKKKPRSLILADINSPSTSDFKQRPALF